MAEATQQFTFRLPKSLARKVEKAAKQRGLARSELMRLALEAYVEVSGGLGPTTPYERVRHLIGSVDTGIPDLAERHSEYLKEVLRRER